MAGDAFKQYALLVKDTAKISDRRQIVNTLYLSANSILLGGIALLVQQSGLKSGLLVFPVLIVAVAGVIFCLDWRRLILNYRELLQLRFKLLAQLEDAADFTAPLKVYQIEGAELYNHKRHGRSILHFGFSRTELNIPIVFVGVYVVICIGAIVLHLGDIAAQLRAWGIPLG